MPIARSLIPSVTHDGSAQLVESVMEPPHFFWNLVCDPIAVHHDGTSYVTGITDDGRVEVASFDHATGTITARFAVASGFIGAANGNIHNSVAICRRSTDGRLVIAYCEGGYDTAVRVRISTNPDDVSAWGAEVEIDAGGSYEYISLYELPEVVGTPIYVFTRTSNTSTPRLAYAKSTDGGATWTGFTNILKTPTDGALYWRIGSDQSGTLHIFVTDTDRADATPSSVYHFQFWNDALYTSDGTAVGGSFPSLVTSGTLVQNASDNSARPEGWAMWNGNPCVLVKSSQVDRDPSVVRACVWNGASWDKYTVGTFGPTFYTAMSKDNPFVVYVSVFDGSRYQMWRYQSLNSGSTWTGVQLTADAALENGAPDTPLNAAFGMRCVWGCGTGLSSSGWDYGLRRSAI